MASRRSGTKSGKRATKRTAGRTTKRKPAKVAKAKKPKKTKPTVRLKAKAPTKAKPKPKPKAAAKAKARPTAKARPAPKARPAAKARPVPVVRLVPKSAPPSAAEAVEAAVAAKSGAAKPFSWGVRQAWADGGEDPLEKVRAYACDDEAPHWHYVGSGLADPDKIDAAPGSTSSGLGYELTFRLARAPEETDAPTWPVFALQELGWGILKARMKLGAGHYLRRRKVITGGDPATELQGYYLLADPQLPAAESASGDVAFLQLVGITEDELLQCEAGDPDGLEADLVARSPLGITDISRTSLPDADPHERLGALQRSFGELCRAVVPEGVTEFSVSATLKEGNLLCAVEAPIPFAINARAEAALRRIFLSQSAAGQTVAQVRAALAAKPDSTWSTVLEFDYAEAEPDLGPN